MINWQYYPKGRRPSMLAATVVHAFETEADTIDSSKHELSSNEVLKLVEPHLTQVGFRVEGGVDVEGPVLVPVLFGKNGKTEKSFHADAFHEDEGFVVEVEAGRAVANNQFLKDIFQACLMHEVFYVAIAVRNVHHDDKDFDKVRRFLEILFASGRMKLPLNGILLLGY
ncbi:MAG: hypothetical protein HY290_04645 [Planctomycetia bacterium]|nr:hypothetical protein [Planctomycetia bacterium]